MRRNLGFTLIELMVVITILSILGAISYSIFSGARRNANDAKIVGDVNQIAKAYEAKYDPEAETYKALDPLKDFASQTIPQHPTGGFYELTWDQTTSRYFRVCAKLNKYSATSQTGACTNTEVPPGCYCKVNSQGIVPNWAALSPDIGPPSAPLDLAGVSGGSQASLSWKRPLNSGNLVITSYNIYRGTTVGTRTLLVSVPSYNGETESYINTALTNGNTYYYSIRAVNSSGESPDSNEVSVIPLSVPSAPNTLTALSSGSGSITLSWAAPSDNGGNPISGYNVYFPTKLNVSLITGLTYIATGLTNGSAYTFTVKAVNTAGEGQGASVNATPVSLLAGWSKIKPITINSQVALSAYQLEIPVSISLSMKADFSDVRFIDSSQTQILSHWKESSSATNATFWVKVPALTSGSNTIYMVYGNPAAADASNGTSTFIFFDDFNDGVISSAWSNRSASGTFKENLGIFKIERDCTDGCSSGQGVWINSQSITLPSNKFKYISRMLQNCAVGSVDPCSFHAPDISFGNTNVNVKFVQVSSSWGQYAPCPASGIAHDKVVFANCANILQSDWNSEWFRQVVAVDGATGVAQYTRAKTGFPPENLTFTSATFTGDPVTLGNSTTLQFNPGGWWFSHWFELDFVAFANYHSSGPTSVVFGTEANR